MKLRHVVATAAACALASLVPASAAQAAATLIPTANADGGTTWTLTETAGAITSQLNVSVNAGKYNFTFFSGDQFVNPAPGGCTNPHEFTRECTFSDQSKDRLVIAMQAGVDFVNTTTTGAGAVAARMTIRGGEGVDTLHGGTGRDDIDGEGGADSLDGHEGDDVVRGGADPDRVLGGTGDDLLDGGEGADFLNGEANGDILRGGSGPDVLQGDLGRDDLFGDAGIDRATYSEKPASAPVDVTIDEVGNDGSTNELDNVHGDVEGIVGTPGNDRLVGNDADNDLAGGAGNDTLIGLGGFDFFSGETGDDDLQTRDGLTDRVDCGEGSDRATTDTTDRVTDCEANAASADLLPDSDGDGVAKPTDCNDGNAAIRPGAREVLDNGVDEDCDGADAANNDRDNDGVTRPLDCNDALATIRPGLREVLGNRVDENCDGTASPFPRLDPGIANAWRFTRTATRVTQLAVVDVPAGATVQTSCTGRGCPRGTTRTRVRKATDELNLQRRFRGRRLRPGAVVEIRITASQSIGKVVRYTVRPSAIPRRTLLCLTPGATRPTPRC